MKKNLISLSSVLILAGFTTGCTSDSWTVDLSLSPSNTNSDAFHVTLIYPDWVSIQPGVSYKQQTVTVGAAEELLHLVQIDQTQATLHVAVNEDVPHTVSAWAKELGASVLINGSYFDENYQLVTRTVSAGASYGTLLTGSTGVAQTSSGEQWDIRSWAGQAITAQNAIQSYPLLLSEGAVSFTTGSADTAQRTVLAVDAEDNLYFIVCEYGVLTLAQLATVLDTDFDLTFQTALNLDGGTSTGLVINTDTVHVTDDSLVVPSVLYLLPQE